MEEFCWQMLEKKVFWVVYTFLQKPSSFKFLSILEENCVANINHGAIKCKFLLTNVSQNVFWVSYTFLQKLSSFKFYSILEENCTVRLLLTIAAKTVFGWVILSCKSQVFSNNSEFDHHFQEISLFSKINDFGEINIWRFWLCRDVMRKKIHLLIN